MVTHYEFRWSSDLDQKPTILRYSLVSPFRLPCPGRRPPGSDSRATDGAARRCRRRSTSPDHGAAPAPCRTLECKCLRISRSSRAAPRTRCPAPAPAPPTTRFPPPPPPPPTPPAPPAASSLPVNAAAVNCTPWSVLKISGLP